MPIMMRTTPIIPAGFISKKYSVSLEAAPATDEIDDQDDDRENEQDINKISKRVSAHDSEQPKHQQNHEYGPQHKGYLQLTVKLLSCPAVLLRLFYGKKYWPIRGSYARSSGSDEIAARTLQ